MLFRSDGRTERIHRGFLRIIRVDKEPHQEALRAGHLQAQCVHSHCDRDVSFTNTETSQLQKRDGSADYVTHSVDRTRAVNNMAFCGHTRVIELATCRPRSHWPQHKLQAVHLFKQSLSTQDVSVSTGVYLLVTIR